jgi:hypothetical protein
MIELHQEALNIVHEKFNVLFEIDCRSFDTNYQVLTDLINQVKKDRFDHKDRIVLVHMDTDYYDPLLPCGLLIINIIRIFKKHQLPLFLLLFITNHFGIKTEFKTLLQEHPMEDWPTIVETLLSKTLLVSKFDTQLVNDFNSIEKQGLCMIGIKRSHRIALCNFLQDNNLLNNVALKTNFNIK